MTGKPSKGKRKIVFYVSLLSALIFLVLNFSGILFSDIDIFGSPAPHIVRTTTHDLFSVFFLVLMLFSWYNFIRSGKRTKIKTSRRRMIYLILSAIGPAFGSFPFLLYGYEIAANNSAVFWIISIITVILAIISSIGMTYTVSFFGFPWPDRVIKSRLFKWVLRGPITASLGLAITTTINRIGASLNIDVTNFVIIGMVASIVLFEFFITLFSPFMERLLFDGKDRVELEKIRKLENQLLTKKDLEQFLEMILATLCDRLQISGAILFEIENGEIRELISIGRKVRNAEKNKEELLSLITNDDEIIQHKNFSIIPLRYPESEMGSDVLGFIVTPDLSVETIDTPKMDAVRKLTNRTSEAISDRRKQDDLLSSLDILTPQVTEIQTILAQSRFNQSPIINGNGDEDIGGIKKLLREALNHYYGGPKLSRSPLISMEIVQEKMKNEGKSSIIALREIITETINKLRPEGNRLYTNEWILFNILDLKFLEGWKVKDIARKLSLSEADFYRKQRNAISALAEEMVAMERIQLSKEERPG